AIGWIGARRDPRLRQFVQRRDERFRYESPAILAESATRIGRRLGFPCKNRQHFFHLKSASRAARTKARTRPASLYPEASSMPEATSTPEGRAWAMACATLSGVSPPETKRGTPAKSARAFSASVQANETPDPPAGPSSRMRF